MTKTKETISVQEMQKLADASIRAISIALKRKVPPVRIDGSKQDPSGEMIMSYSPPNVINWVGSYYPNVPDSYVLLHELGHHVLQTNWPNLTDSLEEYDIPGEKISEGTCEFLGLDVFPNICAVPNEVKAFSMKERKRILNGEIESIRKVDDYGYIMIRSFAKKRGLDGLLKEFDIAETQPEPADYLYNVIKGRIER